MAQGKEAVVPTVHPSSSEPDLVSASETISVRSFEAASEDSSEMTFVDTPEVALVSTLKTGAPPDKATPAKAGEHRDPYLYPRREGQRSAGQARPFAPSDRGLGQRRERDKKKEETEMGVGEQGGSLVAVHSGPGDGEVAVLEVDLDLGKDGIVDNRGVRVQVPRVFGFVAEAERRDQREWQDCGEAVIVGSGLAVHYAVVLTGAGGCL